MAIKIKRGTTASWTLGPELVDFNRSETKDKDSVIRAEGTELEMYVYTESANEWWTDSPNGGGQSTGKIPGLPIFFGIDLSKYDSTKPYQLKIMFDGPEDCTMEYIWGAGLLARPDYSAGSWTYTNNDFASGYIEGFVKWPAEKVGTVEPVPVKIRISFREINAYEELEEGQLGLEYTEDGQVKIKAGLPGIKKWNELPYIGNGAQDIENNEHIVLITYDKTTQLASHGSEDVIEFASNGILPIVHHNNFFWLYAGHYAYGGQLRASFMRFYEGSVQEIWLNDHKKLQSIATTYDLTYFDETCDYVYEELEPLIGEVQDLTEQVNEISNELKDLTDVIDGLGQMASVGALEILPQNEEAYGVILLNEDPYTVENDQPIETLTFYGAGDDAPVRLRHLAPGANSDDAVTVGQVLDFAQGMQADWDIADESNPAAIKNKPFGMVEQMVDIVPETTFTFVEVGPDGTIGSIGHIWSLFEEDVTYSVWLNGEYIGAAQPEQRIPIPNGEFFFSNGALVIYGSNYPEGQYTVRINGPQRTTKKLDSQWLNLCTDVYDRTAHANPITGEAVFNITADYGTWQSSLNGRIDNTIMPAIGPVPTGEDEGKFLQIVNGIPAWEAPESELPTITSTDNKKVLTVVNGEASWELPMNGISVTDDGEGNVEITTTANGSGGFINQDQVEALYGLLKIAAYTEDATAEHDAFLAAFGIGGDTPDAPEEPTNTNLFDKNTMCVDGKYINGAGKIQSNAGSKLARIPVEPNKTYAIQFEEALPGAKIGSIAMVASSDATTAICRANSVTLGFLPYGSDAMVDKVTDLTKNSEGYIYTFTTVEGCYFICFTAHLNDTASVIDAVTMWEV